MSQTQLFIGTQLTELMQSLSVEISIFSVSFLLALAFRAGPFRRTCDGSIDQKPVKACAPKMTRPVDVDKDTSSTHRKPRDRSLVTHDFTGKHTGTHALSYLLESGENWQGADILALYLDVRSNGQLQNLASALGKNKARALEFFGQLVQSAGRRDRPECVSPFIGDMIQLGVERSLGFYESAMKMLASKKYYNEAMSVYKRLEMDGLEPSPVTLSCLISFAVELGDLDQAVLFFDRLSAVSTPSIRACMAILRVHSKRKDWARSLAVIRTMEFRNIAIDCLVLNIVLATGVGAGRLEDAKELLKQFDAIADVVSYNTLMKGFAQQKDYASAVALLDAMRGTSIKPTAITFNTAMDAAVRSSRGVEAWRVLARMRDAGLQPDKFSCTTLIKGLQNGATPEQLHAILDLLRTTASQCDSTLGSSLYHSVVDVVVELEDPVLITRLVAQAREQKIPLPPADNQRLLQLLARDSKLVTNPQSCKPWRNQA
jgi:pentatricopeptide repeat protein